MIDFDFWRFPLNLIAGLIFVILIIGFYFLFRKSDWIKYLIRINTSLVLIGVLMAMLLSEAFYQIHLFERWIFAVVLLIFLFQLGLVVLHRFHRRKEKKRNIQFFLNHAGLFLLLWAACFGAPDRERLKMKVTEQQSCSAYSECGKEKSLPFTIALKLFEIPVNEYTGMPEQYISHLLLSKKDKSVERIISVNHPIRFCGYFIYQDGYDMTNGNESDYSVLQLVYDPWLWLVYIGFILLFFGSMGFLFFKKR